MSMGQCCNALALYDPAASGDWPLYWGLPQHHNSLCHCKWRCPTIAGPDGCEWSCAVCAAAVPFLNTILAAEPAEAMQKQQPVSLQNVSASINLAVSSIGFIKAMKTCLSGCRLTASCWWALQAAHPPSQQRSRCWRQRTPTRCCPPSRQTGRRCASPAM